MSFGRAGNPTPLTDAQRDLAAQHFPLAYKLARRAAFARTRRPRFVDELESEACLALVQAARNFDPALGIKFTTYACGKIKWALHDAWERLFDDPIRLMIDPFYMPLDDLSDAEQFEALIHPLPERQREMCRLIYAQGLTQNEVGAIQGHSGNYICTIHRYAMAYLRAHWRGRLGA